MTTTTGSRHTWTAQNHLFGEIRTPPNINGISWNIDDKTWPYNDYRLDGSYQQCYLALNKWRPYLTYLGIFPITNIFTKDASKKVIQSILLDASKLIWTLITTCIIAATIYLGFFENALRIPSVSESNAMMGFVVVIGVSAFINLITMTVQARHWPLFFRRCEVVDGILGIDCDSQLVSYVRRLVRTYVAFMTLCLGITMAVMYLKVIHGHFPGDLYPVYVILLNTHVLPCIFVPEIMFLFVCIVTSTRLKRLCQQLRRLMMATLMSSTSSYVRYDPLQKLRIAYQLVMIAIQHANHILGPVLIVSCLTNIYCPIVCVYLYVRNITQYGMDIIRVFLTILPVCRIIPICFFAHTAHQDVRIEFE